jgi:hypothetical protein
MSRKQVDVVDQVGATLCRGGAADAFAHGDGLAGDVALEGAEDEGFGVGGVEDVEAGPDYGGGGGGEGEEGVVEEGGGVGEIAVRVGGVS